MQELSTTAEVMDALGGNASVVAITSSNPKAVWNWRVSKTFPANTYVAMTEALQVAGKTAPASLWGMREPATQEPAA